MSEDKRHDDCPGRRNISINRTGMFALVWLRLYLNRKGNLTQTKYESIYYFYFESPLRKTQSDTFSKCKIVGFLSEHPR